MVGDHVRVKMLGKKRFQNADRLDRYEDIGEI